MAEGSVWEAIALAAHYQARQSGRHRRRQRPRPEPAHDVRLRHRRLRRALRRLRLARHRRSTATTWPRSSRAFEEARDGARAAGRDHRAHQEGAGRLDPGGQGQLARQGGEEGRRARRRRSPRCAPPRRRSRCARSRRAERAPRRASGAGASRCRRRSTSRRRAGRRRARPTAPRSPSSAASIRWSTVIDARHQELDLRRALPRRASASAISKASSPSRTWSAPRSACRRAGKIPFVSTLRLLPDARLRPHPHGGDLARQPEDRRLALRRVDRRGRPVADGARGSGDDARGAARGRCSIRPTRWHRAPGRGDGARSAASTTCA